MKKILTIIFLVTAFLLPGCSKKNPGYVVGGVYSMQEMSSPIEMYSIGKVIDVRKDKLVVCFPAGFVQQRPTKIAAFPINAEMIYFYPSFRDFQKKQPVLIGTLPLTERDKEELQATR